MKNKKFKFINDFDDFQADLLELNDARYNQNKMNSGYYV